MTRGSLGAFMDNDSFQLIWDISCCGSFVWIVTVFRKKNFLLVIYQVAKLFTIILKSYNLNAQWQRGLACEQPRPYISTFWATDGIKMEQK